MISDIRHLLNKILRKFSRIDSVSHQTDERIEKNENPFNIEPNSRERVDFQEEIGFDVDPATEEKTSTTWGIIHYSKNGAHIIPARPPNKAAQIDLSYVRCAGTRALLGAVVPNLREVQVDFIPEEKRVSIYFFFHGEIDENSMDSASTAASEYIASFPPGYQLEERIERLDFPNRSFTQGNVIYKRFESLQRKDTA